mmetsp:Transcript_1362/g.4706  ORF Transcript_1362/g.4706 Transcript_1362/m.4706 type:complete len:212 (-) Transcript_1362:365-1000(-)
MFRKFVNSPRLVSQMARKRFSQQSQTLRHKHFYVYVDQEDFYVPVEEDEPLTEIIDVYRSSLRDEHTSPSSFLARNLTRQNQILSQIIDKDLVTDVEQFIHDSEEKDMVASKVKCNNIRPQILIRRNNRKVNKKFLRNCEAKAKAAETESSPQTTSTTSTTGESSHNTSSSSSSSTTTTTTTTPPAQDQTTTPISSTPAAASSTRNNNGEH